jgi:flagellin
MTTSAYKGKNVFVDNASSEYVSMGGRNAEMTFGIGKLTYTNLYATERTISNTGGPNNAGKFNLVNLASDAVAAKPQQYGSAVNELAATSGAVNLSGGKSYVVRNVTAATEVDMDDVTNDPSAKFIGDEIGTDITSIIAAGGGSGKAKTADLASGDHIIVATTFAVAQDNDAAPATSATYAEVRSDATAFVKGKSYVVHALGNSDGNTATADTDAAFIKAASTNVDGTAITGTLRIGQRFLVKSDASIQAMAGINSLIQDMEFTLSSDILTKEIEAVQAKVNTARVQAGSQYAALESAVDYTTDLTAQYELGFNAVNDVNFSMETAHLAKNQILQQAATAMLAQANQGQQGLLQLIQG